MKRSVETKLMAGAGMFALAFAVFAALGAFEAQELRVDGPAYRGLVQNKELRADVMPRPGSVTEAYLIALRMATTSDAAKLTEMSLRLRDLHDQFDERHGYWTAHLPAGPLHDALLGAAYQPARAFYALLEGAYVPAVLQGDKPRASEALALLAARYDELRDDMSQVAQLVASEDHVGEAAAAAAVSRFHWLLLVVALGTIFLALGAAVVFGRRLAHPVRDAALALEALARGELGVRLAVRSEDELGRMAHAFNGATESLEGTALGVQQHASRLVAESESLAQVGRAMTVSVGDSVTKADTMAANAAHVSRSVQSLAGAVDQLQQCIGEISRSATQAAQVAGSAVHVAEAAQATVTRLEQSSEEIGGITKLITSIAEQTNLLALNATIEAARAGDAGKGFAVVAGEVKELARATAGATENISTKVDAIRRDVRDAAAAIVKIGATIQEIASYQTTIASAVEEQTATTKDIGGTLSDAAVGAQQIATSIDNVAEASRSTALGVQSTGLAAQALARMAAEMQSLVAHFHVASPARVEAASGRTDLSVQLAAARGPKAEGHANGHGLAHANGHGLANGHLPTNGGLRNGAGHGPGGRA
jgi:methyl-accepting chemotaxis protein